MDIEALRKKLAAIQEQLKAMVAEGDKDGAYWTDEKEKEFDGLHAQAEATEKSIRRHMGLDAMAGRMGAPVAPAARPADPGTPNQRKESDKSFGFQSLGENLQAICRSDHLHGLYDPRLKAAAPTTYGAIEPGTDGGFMIAPEFSPTVRENVLTPDNLLPLTSMTTIQSNSMSFPADETTPWGTTGVQANWVGEGVAATESKPAGKVHTFSLHKLVALVPLTDELMADAPAMESYVLRRAMAVIRYKINDAIVNGNGVGKPFGFFKGLRFVSQAKVGSQTAATINATNVCQMYGRLLNTGSPSLRWLVSPDSFSQLPLMTIGQMPVWLPPGAGLQGAPSGYLMGAPVITTVVCQTLGTQGDIFLADLSGYETIVKTVGLTSDISMHFYFDAHATALRVTFRMNGMTALANYVTPPNSAITMSSFIALDTRS